MEAREYRVDNFIVLELKGRVDEFNTAVLRDEIHTIINTGRTRLAIDLSLTEFLSAHCLSAIWKCQRRAKSFGGDIALCGATERVAATIKYVALERVMAIHPDLAGVRSQFATMPLQAKADTQGALSAFAWSWRSIIGRFLQFTWVFGLLGALCTSYDQALASAAQVSVATPSTPTDRNGSGASKPLTREDLRELVRRQGAVAQFSSLRKQERLQERDIALSLQLPNVALTTGYLYQSNPNLLTQVANRELNQLRQRGTESEISDFQSRSNFRIDQDVVVVSIGMVQVLYSGGLYEAQMRFAESRIREEDAKAMVDEALAMETAERLYWGAVLGRKKVELLEARLQAARSQRVAKEQSFASRAISRSESAEAELEELTSEQTLLEAQQDLNKALETLNGLLGRDPSANLVLAPQEPERMANIPLAEEYLRIAENRYAEISHAAARMDSARAYEATLAASAVRSPKAFALGAVDHTQGIGDGRTIVNWTLGVAMTLPLFDGGRSYAELEKSRILLSQARLGYDEARRKLELGIREAVSALRTADLKLTIANKAQEIATGRAQAAKEAVSRNQIPKYQYERSNQAELEAAMAVLLAQTDYIQWTARLTALTGEPVP